MRPAHISAGILIAWSMIAGCGGSYSGGGGRGGGGGGQTGARDAVYVSSNASGGEILTFIFNSSAGTLTAYGTPVAGPPGGLDIQIERAFQAVKYHCWNE